MANNLKRFPFCHSSSNPSDCRSEAPISANGCAMALLCECSQSPKLIELYISYPNYYFFGSIREIEIISYFNVIYFYLKQKQQKNEKNIRQNGFNLIEGLLLCDRKHSQFYRIQCRDYFNQLNLTQCPKALAFGEKNEFHCEFNILSKVRKIKIKIRIAYKKRYICYM